MLQKISIAENPIDSSKDKELYTNTSVNNSLDNSDTSLLDIMDDHPIDAGVVVDDDDDEDEDGEESLFNFNWIKQLFIEEQHILEYSLEYGFLRLPPETRKRLNIEVLLVTLGKFRC